jgi:hypothetical protein
MIQKVKVPFQKVGHNETPFKFYPTASPAGFFDEMAARPLLTIQEIHQQPAPAK